MNNKKDLIYWPVRLTGEMSKRFPDYQATFRDELKKTNLLASRRIDESSEFAKNYVMAHSGIVVSYLTLHATTMWNLEKIIIDVDETLLNELTPIGGLLSDPFFYIPYRCPYIAMPHAMQKELDGFFVFLDDMPRIGKVLRFCLIFSNAVVSEYYVGLEKSKPVSKVIDPRRDDIKPPPETKILGGMTTAEADDVFKDIETLLSLIMYLCAESPDIREREVVSGKARKTKKVYGPTILDAGFRIGAKIREYEKASYTEDPQKLGGHVAPHMRRAHWHSFWTGPRDGERHLIVKWLPPIPVGVDDKKEIIPTIRELGK